MAASDKEVSYSAGAVNIPVGWFFAIVGILFTFVGSSSWYMSDQAAEIRSLKTDVVRYETQANVTRKAFDESLGAVRKTLDENVGSLRVAIAAIDTRETRSESQLIYLNEALRSNKK